MGIVLEEKIKIEIKLVMVVNYKYKQKLLTRSLYLRYGFPD
jgi:hypothetical protein